MKRWLTEAMDAEWDAFSLKSWAQLVTVALWTMIFPFVLLPLMPIVKVMQLWGRHVELKAKAAARDLREVHR